MPTSVHVRPIDPHYLCGPAQAADPLSADQLLSSLPAMNAASDTCALSILLKELSDRTLALLAARSLTASEAIAVMRDLGIVLGSVKRHGTEPLSIVPELTPALLALGWQTDLIPRDTVQHYTAWNPNDERRRRYTNDPQEQRLQEAVSTVFPLLSGSLTISAQLARLDPRDARFAPLMIGLNTLTSSMITTIDEVIATVSPQFFAQVLRPYFEDINVAGATYLGPAAAQVPLWLVDLCLWSSDRNGDSYRQFVHDSLPYALPSWRSFYDAHRASPSVVTRLETAFATDPGSVELRASALATSALLRTLKVFRGRHIGIARKAYADDVRLYEFGSGGAPVALLKSILDLTRDNETLVSATGRSHVPSATTAAAV